MLRDSSSSSSLLALSLPLLSILFWGLSLLAPWHLSAQSFQDEKIYQVQGKLLNRLEADLNQAKELSLTLKQQNEELKKQSDGKLELLSQLQTQLQTVSLSLKKSEETTVLSIVAVGSSALVIGWIAGWLIHPG